MIQTETTASTLALRPATEDERRYLVADTWSKSFSERRVPRGLSAWVWHKAYHLGVESLLRQSQVIVATLPHVTGEVLGWVAFEPAGKRPLELHFCFVKQYARRRRVASTLIRAAILQADERGFRRSHHTDQGDALMEALGHG